MNLFLVSRDIQRLLGEKEWNQDTAYDFYDKLCETGYDTAPFPEFYAYVSKYLAAQYALV